MQKGNSGFKCKKCGYCCRTLFGSNEGWIRGLSLTSEERLLFDQRFVFPQWAIGVSRPEYIYQYQLGLAVCPHLSKNNECVIYEKRPLICRCYPFELIGFSSTKKDIMISPECKEMGFRREPLLEDEIPDECKELYFYFIRVRAEHFKKDSHIWYFDLLTKAWRLKK